LIKNVLDKIENARRHPTGGYDRRFGATVKFTRSECEELQAVLNCELDWNRAEAQS
jgi:hypothetical protein